MWCRSAVSFSFLFLVTAPRMRSCACDTASRLCVRTVLCSSAFLSVPLLPSTGSAAGCPALFAGFAGIISESDFFVPFIIGYGLRPSRCGPGTASQGGDEDIPVPAQEVCVHAEGLKPTRGGEGPCDIGPAPVAFCLPRRHRHPGLHCLRRSIPRLYVPLSTLRVLPHGSVPRMTRGQRGSLLLHCDGLAPSTSCRSPGAAAQWLAYALPYRRFVAVLADANARLGADVDRYSFIVVDLHHLLLAGLPAHFESYRQSANSQIIRAEDVIARGCRDIGDRYSFVVAGWNGSTRNIDDTLKQRLVQAVQAALARAPGVEGGIWQTDVGSLAYAFPTYEGTGPKTDLPEAELASIRQVNDEAARTDRAAATRQTTRSQVLLFHACPIAGPLSNITGWTMTRVFTGQGPAYNQLLIGLSVLAVMVLGSAIWLGAILVSWSQKLARLQASLAARSDDREALPLTGERELDRLVDALNVAGKRVGKERRRASAAERLAAVGRLAAGLAHEIRNPIAAMRLKAENAIVSGDEGRQASALQSILEQVARLDALLRDLLAMTQRREPKPVEADLDSFLKNATDAHRELAAAKGVTVEAAAIPEAPTPPDFDIDQVRRALDNLILNAVQNTPRGGTVTVAAAETNGNLHLRVSDTGPGVAGDIRERLFEPFVTARAEGTGLGLAIAREIARAHGGEARLVSSAPSGTVFEIELPWRPS